jgi:hypothetical protein|tara:strand:- start:271 stop:465 length:195 start_codon:yes stop_codon:yes gene_type:complete
MLPHEQMSSLYAITQLPWNHAQVVKRALVCGAGKGLPGQYGRSVRKPGSIDKMEVNRSFYCLWP